MSNTNKNALETLLQTQEAIRRQADPLLSAMRAIEVNSGWKQIVDEANRSRDAMRAALGPFEDFRKAGLFNVDTGLGKEFLRLQKTITMAEQRFHLPEIAEAARLFKEFDNSGMALSLAAFKEQTSPWQNAIDAMRNPWLDLDHQMRSIGGFAELQNIGQALRTTPAFDLHLTDALRIDLGDWREQIQWPAEIFTDVVARTAFYAERGLDPALTAFPAPAFQDSLAIAGLREAPPPLLRTFSHDDEEEQEEAFVRTNAAHDRLQRFESQIRRFINQKMVEAFGDNWTKHRVPADIRNAWLKKRQKALDNGESEQRLIAYADFTDYVPIITRKDNWRDVFASFFKRPTSVQESFQRLYPIRICTMHARLITQDDELYLYVEVKRILSAIGVTQP